MKIKKTSHYFFIFLFVFLVASNVENHNIFNWSNFPLEIGEKSHARSTGGRSGGGSFKKRKKSPSKSRKKSSPNRSTSPSRNSDSDRNNSNRNVTPVPITQPNIRTTPNYTNSRRGGFGWGFLFPLIIFGGGFALILILVWFGSSANRNSNSVDNPSKFEKQRDNDQVTVSKIQVAVYAHTPNIQEDLSDLSLRIDTGEDEGLFELMQESALILLRNSEYWTHVLNVSESAHIDNAEQIFQKYSITERSKFTQETISNVEGNVKEKALNLTDEEKYDIASYVVITLIIGTAHDRPLWDKIATIDELQEALQKIASIREDYLMVFELLWSPQSSEDSLTNDELLLEYTDMISLV